MKTLVAGVLGVMACGLVAGEAAAQTPVSYNFV